MKFKLAENISIWAMRITVYSIILILSYVLIDIFINGISSVSLNFIVNFPRRSGAEGGILPAIAGTIYLAVLAVLFALPLGWGTAVYLNHYAQKGRFARSIRTAIITLAGMPSIVFGLFGLGFFVIFLGFGASILAGSLTLALMILPNLIVSSENALQAVPDSLKEASIALGAKKRQTTLNVIIPYAFSGMITGCMQSIGRTIGSTAPILLTAAAFYLRKLPNSIFDQVMALPYHLYILSTQHPEAHKIAHMQYGTALILIIFVLCFNISAVLLKRYFRKRSN